MPPILVQLLILAAACGMAWALAKALITALAPRAAMIGLEGRAPDAMSPRVGGIGLVVAMLIPVSLAQILAGPLHDWAGLMPDAMPPLRFAGFLTLIIGALAIGWLEDRRALQRVATVVLLAALAIGVACMDLEVRQIALPRLGPIDIPWALGVALAGLWLLTVMLAVNYFDGSDGLAGRLATWVALALLFCTINTVWRFDLAIIAAAIFGAASGFLGANLGGGERRVLLGNGGSLALGAILGGVLLLLVSNDLRFLGERSYHDNLLTAAILLALPLYEFVRAMIARMIRGESVFATTEDALYLAHRRAAGGSHLTTLAFVEPFLITFAILGAVATRFDSPAEPSSERMVLVLLLAATTCTFYRLKVRRAQHKAEEDG